LFHLFIAPLNLKLLKIGYNMPEEKAILKTPARTF